MTFPINVFDLVLVGVLVAGVLRVPQARDVRRVAECAQVAGRNSHCRRSL
jgi:hypothetical protein